MELARCLFTDCLYKMPVVMPQAVDSDSCYKVNVFTSVCTVHSCILSFNECQVKASVVVYNLFFHTITILCKYSSEYAFFVEDKNPC